MNKKIKWYSMFADDETNLKNLFSTKEYFSYQYMQKL